ncbi:MAG: PIN domain nuclease [Deltaproteobacteria bacterium]|nr:PIN domain nuclease [Deltaproteobacteria bacterium]
MSLILDAGAFLAVERGDRSIMALLKQELLLGRPPATHGGVVGQVWRGGARQARLAQLLQATRVAPLDDELGRKAGILLGRARKADVADAALVLIAADGDLLLTSDPHDLRALAAATGMHLDVVQV